jgi:ribonuclease P protein component
VTGRFTRQQRLLQADDFKRVFEKPERCSDRYFTILYIASHDRDHGRLGLAITKKRARRAVDRNRIKRIIRESFRQHQPHLSGKDIVVLARDETARADNPKLFRSLQQHWQKIAK